MDDTDATATALRAFTRFYTRRIGVLHERLLASRFSLAESRVIWELAEASRQGGISATPLGRLLQLDPGYLSRLLAGLRERGLVKGRRADGDRRQTVLSLSASGRRVFRTLDSRSQAQMRQMLTPLSALQQQELRYAAGRIGALLGDAASDIALRPHRSGDIGWVVSRHGALYASEYGWDQRFEALVARIAADFIDRFDAQREACWIAERDGTPLGCVFLVQARSAGDGRVEPGVAQLRMLLVEPSARGLGLGRRLAQTCEDFAHQVGYRRIRLWTNSVLLAARGIYVQAGYRLVASETHASFGQTLVGEIWEKDLSE